MKMKKPLKPLLWVLILVMSVSLIMVFSSGGCRPAVQPVEEPVVEEPVTEEATVEPKEEALDESEAEEIDVETTTTEEAPTAIQDNQKYSRTSPAVIGDVIVMEKEDWVIGKVKYEIELLEVITGALAWDIILEANMFNEEPGEGEEYIY